MEIICIARFKTFISCSSISFTCITLIVCSYAPASVDEVFDDYSCSVKFYDGTRSIVEREDVFLTDEDTYHRDVEYIHKCEEELVNQAVVARDNSSGVYRLGNNNNDKLLSRLYSMY